MAAASQVLHWILAACLVLTLKSDREKPTSSLNNLAEVHGHGNVGHGNVGRKATVYNATELTDTRKKVGTAFVAAAKKQSSSSYPPDMGCTFPADQDVRVVMRILKDRALWAERIAAIVVDNPTKVRKTGPERDVKHQFEWTCCDDPPEWCFWQVPCAGISALNPLEQTLKGQGSDQYASLFLADVFEAANQTEWCSLRPVCEMRELVHRYGLYRLNYGSDGQTCPDPGLKKLLADTSVHAEAGCMVDDFVKELAKIAQDTNSTRGATNFVKKFIDEALKEGKLIDV